MMDAVQFAAMAATAQKVIAHNTNLQLSGVHIHESVTGTVDRRFRPAITIQAPDRDALRHMALWAIEFGTLVRLVDRTDYVEVTTETVVDGHTVVVWDHLYPAEVARLLMALGLSSVASLATVEPATLLAVESSVAGAP